MKQATQQTRPKSLQRPLRIPEDDYRAIHREVHALQFTREAISCNLPPVRGTNLQVMAMEDGMAFIYTLDETRPQWLNSPKALMRIMVNPKTKAVIGPTAQAKLRKVAPTLLNYLSRDAIHHQAA